jgi:hypothetical protein
LPLQPLLSSGIFFWTKQELAGLVYMHTRLGHGCHRDKQAHFAMPTTYWL